LTLLENVMLPGRMVDRYQATNPAQIYMMLNSSFSADDVNRLARMHGASGIEGAADFGAPWRNASIVMRDYAPQRFNTLELLNGAWPTQDTVAVDITAVETLGLPTPGTLMLKLNYREWGIKIGGVVHDLAITAPAYGGSASI
jgi:hypothetical protein